MRSSSTPSPVARLQRTGLLDSYCGALSVRIAGSCMEPTIFDGDRLAVESRRPHPGDVVVFFDRHSRLVAHRFLGSWPVVRGREPKRWAWVSAADNARALDRPVPRSSFVGIVTGIADQPYRPSLSRRLHSTLRLLRFATAAAGRRIFSARSPAVSNIGE